MVHRKVLIKLNILKEVTLTFGLETTTFPSKLANIRLILQPMNANVMIAIAQIVILIRKL